MFFGCMMSLYRKSKEVRNEENSYVGSGGIHHIVRHLR